MNPGVSFFSTEAHYADFLRPIYQALIEMGVKAEWRQDNPGTGLNVVASFKDLVPCPGPVVLQEHGAGMSYLGPDGKPDRNPSNPGGTDREKVALFLCPNEDVARRNAEAYPGAQTPVVGSVRLEALLPLAKPTTTLYGKPWGLKRPLTVAFAFHWNNPQCPETRWALPHYVDALKDLAANPDIEVLGHGHPRAIYRLTQRYYAPNGIETVSFEQVMQRADVLLVDNSSVMYEAAALGMPVVALNCPTYRKDVNHGLRFWRDIPGPQVDFPEQILSAVAQALAPEWESKRAAIASKVFPVIKGSAVLAAENIRGLGVN